MPPGLACGLSLAVRPGQFVAFRPVDRDPSRRLARPHGIFGHSVTFQLVVTRPPAYGRIRVAERGADIVAVAAWLGDTVETVHRTYAHPIPGADDRGRKAMDESSKRAGDEGSAWMGPQVVQFDTKPQVSDAP